ncbi:hypothetical protein B0O80DRAFT_141867 [Mortierella sp. GBAus27b]|nr:hypothetical protein B0O80DRAFT_141867 [Mortierella sp. GBAus27b]
MFVRRQKANRRTKAMRTYLNPTITADPSDRPGTFHGQSFRQGMLPPLINEYEYGGHDDLNGASNVHGSRMVPSPPSSQGRLLHKPSRSPGSSLSLNNIKWASSMPRAQQSVPDDMYPHYEPCSRPYAGHETFSPYIFLEPEATYNPHGWIEGYDYPHHDQDGPQQYVASYPQDHCYPMEPRHYLEEDKYSSFVTPVTTGPVMTSSATPTVPVSVSQTWQPRPPVFQDAQEPHRGPEDHGENGNGDV